MVNRLVIREKQTKTEMSYLFAHKRATDLRKVRVRGAHIRTTDLRGSGYEVKVKM